MKWTPRLLRWGLNIFGPYLGAGVHVTRISPDWRELDVSMKLRWYNRNIVGVHFGGSLYSMVDPHLMLLLMQSLGRGYVVWDKSAKIDFKRPGKGTVHARIRVTDDLLETIREETADGTPYLPELDLDIIDSNGDLVATVRKTLHIRRKRPEGTPSPE